MPDKVNVQVSALRAAESGAARLSDAQYKAVCHGEGPMLVLAGPGSGKTYTITNRISELILTKKVNPGNILVITFTRDAALNMQRRFRAAQVGSCPVHFGTFHAIFYQILKKSGCRQADSILTDSDKKNLMLPLLKEFRKESGQTTYLENELLGEEVTRCLNAISYYKNTMNPDMAAAMLEEPYRSGFLSLLTKYEEKRTVLCKMDFDDMLYQCLELLKERKELLREWQKLFQYILVDEFQDINRMQYQIIRLLAGEKANLFVVGDDDQSIYGFRGSEPGLMMQFLQDYPNCEKVHLDINYRSHPAIVEASLKVINENKHRFAKQLKAHRLHPQKTKEESETVEKDSQKIVEISHFTEKSEQYEAMLKYFSSRIPEELAQNAVLFRTNAMMQAFAVRLLKAGIPYCMKEKGKCIYDHFVMKDISCYFQVAEGVMTRSLLLKIMNKPYRGIPREALETEQISFARIRSYYRKYQTGSELAESLIRLGGLEDGLKCMQRLSPYLALTYLRKAIGYDEYLKRKSCGDKEKLAEWLEIVEQAAEELKDFESAKEWLAYQDVFRQALEKNKEVIRQAMKGVQLMTVHASKGLEFEQVWIPDINEGIFPHGRLLSEEQVEEERRLLYVAMTRAKNSLKLSFVTGTKERPRLMSRFLNPLM